ncbi:hypothetical protein EJ05DRAFT_450171 [Pseudovirgaria hyperparasitica]|uniref:ABC transporter domain-containing protein n=1 Tax=Pseudovirgaria hyperparasitica TaxID=470096 RepID=A0A6A6WC99_9PEZI|nr:uncharacterized protein EJ05DRAFT_450171 [Pseudovirgaria hyperparasitica]KAF2760458.1 hypothetical protein EJ05DRAFT_450171 [Pseudovirgaria hyperparasitica]
MEPEHDVSSEDEEKSGSLDNEIHIPRLHLQPQQLGVTWTNLTVKGVSADSTINENVFSQFNSVQQFKESRKPSPLKTIIDSSHGHVKPGQMLLVVGRPGAGCTTLLKMLSNRRNGYKSIEGEVSFGSMDHKEASNYPGQIVMSSEEEVFFPTLTVSQTMDFATRMKIPTQIPDGQTPEEYRLTQRDHILKLLGIDHTLSTKVGNEFIRGVSGGERKRVSIAECLATRGSIFCMDNSIRGLDASTALEFTRALRALTDILGLTTICTFYQAGNGIFNLFDQVLVLDHGKQIFYGPREQAVPFMQDLGFYFEPSANIGDSLAGVTIPSQRMIRKGYEDRFPRTAEEIRAAYEKSDIKKEMESTYKYPGSQNATQVTQAFKENVLSEKHKSVPKTSGLTVAFLTQVKHCTARQYQILWGDKPTLFIKQVSILIQALLTGSLFYSASADSTGLFIKGGAIFLAALYPALLAMSETTDSFTGRPVLAKHREFAFYHPAAFCIAQIAADIPVLLVLLTHFSLILYFMVGLKMTAGAFFTFYFCLIATSLAFASFFRFIGAAFPNFEAASKVSGFAIAAIATYAGYMIQKPQMHPWFVWIFWINPMSYAFDALLSNEFRGQNIDCAGPNLVPLGQSYTDKANQACTGIRGAPIGATSLTGDEYLGSLSFNPDRIWGNIGVVLAWWVFYTVLTIVFTSRWKSASDGGRSLLVPRETVHLVRERRTGEDIESQAQEKELAGSSTDSSAVPSSANSLNKQLLQNKSVFTWKNLSYTVNTPDGERKLLDDVYGWVKPGMLGALMGSSGAGKTTLMDVLAQRKTDGKITGSILVDGRELSLSFQRSAGYCEQLDVHERMSTVRESLEFAALLRQSRDTPDADKIRYVDSIIDLLELHDIEHTLIGRPGNGLSVEQRKRVTIGVELVSKPEILIFLDEPTSGLDGQAAFGIVRFLRKLADIGQAVLVVIHQPSASLFAQFDTLLLLQKGGRMSYFGDIGENGATVKDYFARHGAPCPDATNPAEHMIDVVSGSLSKTHDWHQVWLDSPEHKRALENLDSLVSDAASKPPGTEDDGHEFAASHWTQTRILMNRMNRALYRDVEYVNNRVFLHIGSALFNGFSFWMIGDSVSDLQLRLFTIFNFIFVAPGVFAQLQPLFLERRDVYEAREKKSKTYSWPAFVTALIVSEIPYLLFSGLLYFVCWYYTVGFPTSSARAGATLLIMLLYEFLYTGMGQFVAAYAPNAIFAALVNPVIIGVLVSFCGVLVPYAQITAFWRYWLYYLDPFNYLMGAMLVFTTWGVDVQCRENEYAIFDPPQNQTCGDYLSEYLLGAGASSRLLDASATQACRVCQYKSGSEYLQGLNLMEYRTGWRNVGIVTLFCFSSYALVYGLMKLRTKATKKAEGK